MLKSIEDLFKYVVKDDAGTTYTFYKRSGRIVYDYIWKGAKIPSQIYLGTEAQLFHIVKGYTIIGSNPFFDGTFIIAKIKELEERFANKKKLTHAK